MTFRERLKKEHPESISKIFYGGCRSCPSEYEYEPHENAPCYGDRFANCTDCWNREIPNNEECTNNAPFVQPQDVSMTIRDSGDRTPMGDTGFVRDNHAGKGRMDLLPWNAIIEVSQHCEEGAKKYGERNIDKGAPLHSLLDSGMRHAAKYILGMDDEDHLRAACWNFLWALEQRTTHPDLNDMPWEKKEEYKCHEIEEMKSAFDDFMEKVL